MGVRPCGTEFCRQVFEKTYQIHRVSFLKPPAPPPPFSAVYPPPCAKRMSQRPAREPEGAHGATLFSRSLFTLTSTPCCRRRTADCDLNTADTQSYVQGRWVQVRFALG